MIKEFFKTIGGLGIYLAALFLPFFIIVYYCYLNFAAPLEKLEQKKLFLVKDGQTISEIAESLENEKIIKNSWSISFITNFRMSEEESSKLKVSSGEYSLSPTMKPKEILQILLSGKVITYDLIIPPAATIYEIAEIIAKSNLTTSKEALGAMKNTSLMAALGIPANIPEGFLFQGTYNFTKPTKAEDLIRKLIPETEKLLNSALPSWREDAQKLGFQPYELLKLASIIEKESLKEEEKEIIASVFHNRIRIGLPIQSQAALAYGLQKRIEELSEEDKKESNPYNTFLAIDLPVTPICSPSISSIQAALKPKDTDFLFMAKTAEQTHDFSSTLEEHDQKEKKYRNAILGLGEL